MYIKNVNVCPWVPKTTKRLFLGGDVRSKEYISKSREKIRPM